MYVMRRLSLLFVAILALNSLPAQQPVDSLALQFDEVEWNFGRIDEQEGEVSHTFRYRNISDRFVAIERVYSSCGCTTGEYSRRPLKPGGEQTFTVVFDPEGRSGKVEKSITIVYDQGRGRTTLNIKGRVRPRPRSVADEFPYDLGGGLRSDADYRAFGNVAQGTTRSMTFALLNNSAEPMTIGVEWLQCSGLLELNLPEELAPTERALVTMTYVPSRVEGGRYGLVRDSFRIVAGGVATERVINTSCVGVDYFEGVDDDAPRAKIEPVYHDFGTAPRGAIESVEVKVSNLGREPLVIRAIELREGTTIELEVGESIAPGATRVATMEYRVPELGYDVTYGGVMIVVNDPVKPVRELRVSASVDASVAASVAD